MDCEYGGRAVQPSLPLSSPSELGTALVLFSPPVPSILFSLFSGTEIGRVHILLLILSSLQFLPAKLGNTLLCSPSHPLLFSKVCTLGSILSLPPSVLLQERKEKEKRYFTLSILLLSCLCSFLSLSPLRPTKSKARP